METGNNLKYIIYLTTNLVNNKIYIGLHKTYTPYEFDGYLGCGVKVGDKHTYIHCNTPFESAVNKYGVGNFKRETLFVFDTLEEAINKEIELVDEEFIKRKDTYNIALGGGVPPAITKTVYQFTLDGEFIKEWSSITEAARQYKCHTVTISRAVLDKTPSLGFLWSDSDKITITDFRIDGNKKKVYLYNIKGELIHEFKSQVECAEYLSINCATVQKLKTSLKPLNNMYYISNDYPLVYKKESTSTICQYTLEGLFIKEWNSFEDIKKSFKNWSNIKSSISLNQSCNGFIWRYEKCDQLLNLPNATKPKRVGKYDLNGKLIQVFDTVGAAKRDTVGAPMVLTGRRKTAGGFVFKYI